MKKEFYSDIIFNKQKRRSAVILNMLLVVISLGTASIFLVNKDWLFGGAFVFIAIFPISLIPVSFRNYPIHGKPIITVTDKEITVMNETVKVKDITKIKVLIDLPPCTDAESVKALEDIKTVHPGYDVYGNLDMFYVGSDGKKKIVYSHVSNVIEALEDMLYVGVKNYSVTYSIKKNTVISEFDFRKVVSQKKQEENNKLSEKQKKRQLI